MGVEVISNRNDAYAYTDLINKIKQLEGVTHMIAHNLRGAGANIKMLSEVLMKKDSSADGPVDVDNDDSLFTTGEAVQFIHESSDSLISTLNTLMEVADIQLNEKIKYDECDIAAVAEHIIFQLHGLIHQKNAVITYDLALKTILYPAAYMESILYNFINNALKYSKPDVPLKITISTHIHNNRPVLTVTDNGLGIDLERYGNRMFKLKQVFHAGYESKGIGLFITKTQIESLGGSIKVKSKVGEGSEFIVYF